jgi:uncharacterized protein YbjQ (UPF0145 family)
MTWGRSSDKPLLLTTTSFVPGMEIDSILGLVVGAEKLGRGGTNNVEEKTQEAIERLTTAAQHVGADAVIELKISPVQPAGQHGSDDNYSVLCYGTAVKLRAAHL